MKGVFMFNGVMYYFHRRCKSALDDVLEHYDHLPSSACSDELIGTCLFINILESLYSGNCNEIFSGGEKNEKKSAD